jgi:hypothetical protein
MGVTKFGEIQKQAMLHQHLPSAKTEIRSNAVASLIYGDTGVVSRHNDDMMIPVASQLTAKVSSEKAKNCSILSL